jgi:iron complex outermembrane receptor protein
MSPGLPPLPPGGELTGTSSQTPYFDEELDVITVTVDRREKNLQDYAGSATAFSQDDLERNNVNSIRTLSTATPYVQIGTQEGNTEIYIRGVGSDYNTELGDPAAATHVDGVYIPRPRGVGSMLFDLERVEVNRGPQGTIRGRNATAGTINIVTAKPKFGEWNASGSAQLGNYAQRLTRAMVNIPIGDKLALRVASYTEVHDPYYKNAGPIKTITPAESADVLGYRASARWEPFRRLTATVQHDFTRELGTGVLGTNYTPALEAGLMPDQVKNPRSVIYRGGQPSQDLQHWGVYGDVKLDLGPVIIGYLGSYRNLDYRQNQGSNAGVAFAGMPTPELDNWSSTYWHSTSKSVVQELRIYAPDNQRVRWSAGGFFFNEQQSVFLGTTADQTTGFAGVEFNMPKVDGRSWAGFLDATADLLKNLRATAGIRATTEQKSRSGIGHIYSFSGLGDTPARFGTEGFSYRGLGRTDYTVNRPIAAPFNDFRNGIARFGARDTLDQALRQPGVTLGDNINEQHGKYDNTFLDFRAGLDYDITDSHLVYALFATGHKSGGFNDNFKLPDGSTLVKSYKPEVLYAFEVGSKNDLFSRHLIANVSGFYYDYRDQQFQTLQQLIPDTGTSGSVAASAVRFNAASSRILGLETDVTGRLPYGFVVNLAALLLDARFADGNVIDTRVNGSGPPTTVSLEGNRLPRSPVASLNYGIGQTIESNVGYWDWQVAAQTKSKQYMTVFNGNGQNAQGERDTKLDDHVGRYSVLNASAGYTRPDGRLRLELFGTNLTNTTYVTTINSSPDLQRRFFNAPRQLGVRLSVSL